MQLRIDQVISEKFNVNSWVLSKGSKCIIIDSNCNVPEFLIRKGFLPVMIFLTHEHFDHIESLNQISLEYNAPVVASSYASGAVSDVRKNLSFYFDGKGFCANTPDIIITDRKIFRILDTEVECVSMPGHSPGGIVIHVEGCLFTGDTILEKIKTPTKFPGGDVEKLKESLDYIDTSYSGCTAIYPGHGNMFLKKDWDKLTSLGI